MIETRPSLLRGSVLKFAYRILRKAPDGEEPKLLAEGETVHVVCDDALNRKPLPEHYAEALRTMMTDKLNAWTVANADCSLLRHMALRFESRRVLIPPPPRD